MLNKRPVFGELEKGDVVGIRGAINSHGQVVAHEHLWLHDETNYHTKEEIACGTTFCWDVVLQEFENHRRPQPRHFTDEERIKILDWLAVRGYLYDEVLEAHDGR